MIIRIYLPRVAANSRGFCTSTHLGEGKHRTSSAPFASPGKLWGPSCVSYKVRDGSCFLVEGPPRKKGTKKLSLLRALLALIVVLILAHIVLFRLGYDP